ncbi:tetratricopeptide repeat protein [Chitinimonas sp. JJ19]|uniref:tetratricopeptide repeat protein n=1 Tax=Chitinimonas sp. JJ19 TaxID=3109352 RepID=UPI0030036483
MTSSDTDKLARFLGYLEQDPDNIQLLLDTAELCFSAGDLAQGEALLDQGLAKWPAHPALAHRRALLCLQQNDPTTALALLNSLQGMGHAAPGLAYNLAYAKYQTQDFSGALAHLTQLSADELAQLPHALHLWVLSLHQLGQLPAARAKAEQALAQRPEDAEMAGMLSLVCLDDNDAAACLRWGRYSLDHLPDQLHALIATGSVDIVESGPDVAIPKLQRALALAPKAGRAWSALALAYFYQRQFAEAEQAFEQAVHHMPEHIGTWHAYGWLHLLQGRLDQAETCFRQALALDRNFGESYGGLAVVAHLKGQQAEADPLLARARRLSPGGISSRYIDLLQAQSTGDSKAAEQLVQDAFRNIESLANRPLSGETATDIDHPA